MLHECYMYFTDNAFAKTTFPDACGSFDRLPEDTSILAQNCDKWGKVSAGKVQVNQWGWHGKSDGGRLSTFPFVMYGTTVHSLGLDPFTCDDSFESPQPRNANDKIRISVR